MEDDINMAWWCLDDYDALHSDDDGALHSDDDGALAGWVGEATDHAALPVDGEQAGAALQLDCALIQIYRILPNNLDVFGWQT